MSSKALDDLAEAAVVHVEHAFPEYLLERWNLFAALVEIVVEQGRDGVVGRSDRMEITREVEVDLFHGQNLRVTTTGSTTLEAEAGTEGGLAKHNDGFLADAV